ncbi:helix-turn-helix domain-containing protein [Nocardioides hwasunensis]|uniref:AraC family transcriptional regulator n=1 Tax=Nocardioides hwasunensis TaxID=397258 RepID=A0ABR8MGJ9_9ACTN|nr:helix-turn-helix domain-containing protein [Nocardioides hwasunensis]MBD3915200.1 AraC family transcriptional regulator [Nocardioides hwasunensis]
MPRSVPGSTADHLRALVERAATDDDPVSTRLRTAMAGESPARFRDRLLLERAAHLTRATCRTLQDIAADCGFRGYDVFVRAFRRELGASPSQWRADPTSGAIDAPGEVHFQPPDGLRLPARSRMDGTDLVVDLVEQHVRTLGDLVDAAGDDPALRSLLTQLVGRLERLTALVHETAHDVPVDLDAEPLRARLDRIGPDYVATVGLLGAAGRFDEALVDSFSPAPTLMTLGDMVSDVVTDAGGLLRAARARLAQCRPGA